MKVMILLKFPLYGGGSGTYTRKLAETLAKDKNYEIAVVSADSREVKGCKNYEIKPAFKCVFEAHPEMKRAKRYSKLTGAEFTRQYQAYLRDITKAIEDFKPDVVHVNHASFLTWIASFVKSMFGIAYVTTVHGTGVYNATIDPRYRVLTAQALERSESIIAVSPHTKKWFLKVFGLKLKRRTRVIPNCIVLNEFPRTGPVKVINKKYDLEGKKVVIFVGRLTWEKGIEYLIKAAKNIKAEIFIIGGGVQKDYLQNLAKLIGVKNVHFLGYFGKEYVDELREFYRRADALVLPSVVDESTGLVILEAMACGTPVVASEKGGIPMVVKDGHNGFLVRARSAKAISIAVNKILKDPELAKKLGENARSSVEEKLNWQALVHHFKNTYDKAFLATERMQRQRNKSLFGKEDLNREKYELKKKIGYVS